MVQVDTSDILFIAAGTFADLFERERPSSRIGFGEKATASANAKELSTEDLLSYGMLKSCLGRLRVQVQLSAVRTSCARSLPGRAILLAEYQRLLALDNVQGRLFPGWLYAKSRVRRQGLGRVPCGSLRNGLSRPAV